MERSQYVAVEIVLLERNAVVLIVNNNTDADIVLLSPEMPRRQADEQQCVLTISTVVDNLSRPFEFTPTLVDLKAGSSMRFRANLEPVVLPPSCREWDVVARYAHISPDEVERYRDKTSEEFRQYVLKSQRITSVAAKLAVR